MSRHQTASGPAFDDTVFSRPARVTGDLVDAESVIITARHMRDIILEQGDASHKEFARRVTDPIKRRARTLKVGRIPDAPISDTDYYWLYAVPTASTAPNIEFNGWRFDADEAIDPREVPAALDVSGGDGLSEFLRTNYELLETIAEEDDRPVSKFELWRDGTDLADNPARADQPSRTDGFEALADAPGVRPPNPDAPAWSLAEGTDE